MFGNPSKVTVSAYTLHLMLTEPWDDWRAIAHEAAPLIAYIARYRPDEARLYRAALIVKMKHLVMQGHFKKEPL